MGYDYRARASAVRNDYYRWPHPLCSYEEPVAWKYDTGTVQPLDSNVYSWRGPIETIRVGSKRRRKFRDFRMWRGQEPQVRTLSVWCAAPGKNLVGSDFVFVEVKHLWNLYKNYPIYAYRHEGSKFPYPFGQTELDELGRKHRDHIVSDLYVKLKDPRFDSAVFIAELAETLASIKVLLKGALKGLTSIRHRDKLVKHFALNSEELWLWWRYFLGPAMMDAEDLLKALKPQAKIDRCQTGKPKKTTVTTGTIYSHGWVPNVAWEIPWKQTTTIGCGGAIDILHRFDPSPWGISAVDVIRAGWEIIPFSFIFDWFINLGDFLTSLRQVEIDYAQSYATFAVDTKVEFFEGPRTAWDINPVVRWTLIDRTTGLEPPSHPMVNTQWFNALRTVDSISLLVGILKGVLRGKKQRKPRRTGEGSK